MSRKMYTVRKRSGLWTVWSDDAVFLNFQSYDEAIETARTAAIVLAHRSGETHEKEPHAAAS